MQLKLRLSIPLTLLISAALLMALGLTATAHAFTWQPPQRVGPDEPFSDHPAVAVNAAGDAIVAWQATDPGVNRSRVRFAYRPADGSWTAPAPIAGPEETGFNMAEVTVAIDADGGAVAAWTEHDNSSGDTWVRASRRTAGTWSTPANLSSATFVSTPPQVAVSEDGDATVVFTEHPRTDNTQEVLRVATSAAGTAAWSAETVVTSDSPTLRPRRPSLSLDPAGNALIAYIYGVHDGELRTIERDGPDGDWSAPETLATEGVGTPTAVLDPDGNETVVYQNSASLPDGRLAEVRRPAGSNDWSAPAAIPLGDLEYLYAAAVAASADGTIAVAALGPPETDLDHANLIESVRAVDGEWSAPEIIETDSPDLRRQITSPPSANPDEDLLRLVVDDAGQTQLLYLISDIDPDRVYTHETLHAATRPPGGPVGPSVQLADEQLADDYAHTALGVDGSGRATAVYLLDDEEADGEGQNAIAAIDGDEDLPGFPPGDPGSPGDGDPGPGPSSPGSGSGGPGSPAGPGQPSAPGVKSIDTSSVGRMPNLLGQRLDRARDRVAKAGIRADFDVTETHRKYRGRGIGDVVTQWPRKGTRLSSSVARQPRVKLSVYIGPKVSKRTRKCPVAKLGKALRKADLDLVDDVLAGQRVRTIYDVTLSKKTDEAELAGLDRAGGCRAEAEIKAPQRPADNDLFLTVREQPSAISFEAKSWTLTAGERNAYTIQVVDRAGRLVRGAELLIDNTGTGAAGQYANQTRLTNGRGEASVISFLPRRGTINILAKATGRNGLSIYGSAQLRVVDRSGEKIGARLETVTGRQYKRVKGGWSPAGTRSSAVSASAVRTAAAQASGGGNPFTALLGWLRSLLSGSPADTSVLQRAAPARDLIRREAAQRNVFPAQVALGQRIGRPKDMARLAQGQVYVIAAGGGNVIAAGGGNAFPLGNEDLERRALGVIAAGGGNLVSDKGLGVIAAGGGNVIAAGGGNVVVAAAAGVIAAGGGNVIASGGGNVIAAGGANVIAAGGGNVISYGGGNVIAAGGGN